MFAEERRQKIIAYVKKNNRVTVDTLCEVFDVSPATVRKDLNVLNEKNLLQRTHGGALANNQVVFEANTVEKKQQYVEEKRAIAELAVKYIHENDCIALDTGTTTLELAKLLGRFKNLKVITNDLTIASWLDNNTDVTLFVIGGQVRKDYHYMTGAYMQALIQDINIDVLFLSTNGVDAERGLTTPQLETGHTKELLIGSSRKKILLSDSSKIGKICFSKYADIKELDIFITDSNAGKDEIKEIEDRGVRVINRAE